MTGVLYVVGGSGDSTLATADPDGMGGFTLTKIGSNGDVGANVSSQGGIAAHPSHGLYGITSFNDTPVRLYQIDPTTGVGTSIGNLNIPSDDGFSFCDDCSFGPDGTLYALCVFDPGPAMKLYTINLATGAATLVGTTGLNVYVSKAGFGIDASGVGWLISAGTTNALYSVDLSTGTATTEAATVTGLGTLQPLAASVGTDDGLLYITTNSGFASQQFMTVDLAAHTASALTVVQTGFSLNFSLSWTDVPAGPRLSLRFRAA